MSKVLSTSMRRLAARSACLGTVRVGEVRVGLSTSRSTVPGRRRSIGTEAVAVTPSF